MLSIEDGKNEKQNQIKVNIFLFIIVVYFS